VGYDLCEDARQAVSRRTIDDYMITGPITLSPDDDITRAAGIMAARMIRRLPVVSEGRLVGTVGRADVCRAALERMELPA